MDGTQHRNEIDCPLVRAARPATAKDARARALSVVVAIGPDARDAVLAAARTGTHSGDRPFVLAALPPTAGADEVHDRLRGGRGFVLVDLGERTECVRRMVFELRAHPALRTVPVVVVGGFRAPGAVERLLRAGVTTIVDRGPFVDLEGRAVRAVLDYWTTVAVLPFVAGGGESDASENPAEGLRDPEHVARIRRP